MVPQQSASCLSLLVPRRFPSLVDLCNTSDSHAQAVEIVGASALSVLQSLAVAQASTKWMYIGMLMRKLTDRATNSIRKCTAQERAMPSTYWTQK
eukprot:m.141178 g.141178  ORF g.141178 m.141178 type:complete len:95 (+) comp10019_c1_seq1:1529-1813(+)